jgi:hypothetical protein
MAAKKKNKKPQVPFTYKLVLNQWMFSLFGMPSRDGFYTWNGKKLPLLAAFKEKFQISEDSPAGLDENNIHRFYQTLTNQTEPLTSLPDDLLLEYDQNIVRHTQRLNERRLLRGENAIAWKYFQYMSLLFTEIYLDRYFSDPLALLGSINEQISRYNEDKPEADRMPPLDPDGDVTGQLNKLAFWSATGSGKTLIMHANILQYQHYLSKHRRRRELNRIILLTPNEGLSHQHQKELEAAGIFSELFDKKGRGLFAGQAVEIIDINKLRDEMGDKTVAVDAFENNNLVLIDEGHRGASSGDKGTWMRFRNVLCEQGFSFEYSATFGQAVKGSPELTALYGRCVLFDYSYKYFHGDGYGKEYQILNLDAQTQQNALDVYLVACLLSFFQQLRLHREQKIQCQPFHIEKPLWVFVGSRVTASLSQKEASDIVEILRFVGRFLGERSASIEHIGRVLAEGLVAADGRDLFAGRFAYLNGLGLSAGQLYEEIQTILFNAPGGGALHVENLKGVAGEVALRVGDNDPFGVINVGDDGKLCNLCEGKDHLLVGERDFNTSLFKEINEKRSSVNLLIGSKKFTEGWNSWRVSTMGLMNVGKTEGAQIIQLFGRGVRLKGYDRSLKRSTRVHIPDEVVRPSHLSTLETLNIFGIKADYMAQFREFLEEEGLPANGERIEFFLPVIRNLGRKKLKTIRLKKTINGVSTEFGDAFKKLGPIPELAAPNPGEEPATRYLQNNPVVLNWYPKIQALRSTGPGGSDEQRRPNQGKLTREHIAFLNLDALSFELQRFKAERAWHNLNLPHSGTLAGLLADQSWYRLLIPETELVFDSFEKVYLWQELAEALLKKYCERYYFFRKKEWELPHLEYCFLAATDPNFPPAREEFPDGGYRILVEESQTEIIKKLKALKAQIDAGKLKPWQFAGLRAIPFGRHLYEPLLHLAGSAVEISPVPLNQGERRFVEDLKAYHDSAPSLLGSKELYLLRNLSKGRGVGFFEAGNFHPDFILWLIADGREYISFVDPKGIRNLGFQDPKIQFYKTIKEIETRLDDPSVTLNSFVVSNTPVHEMEQLWGVDREQMEACHILFQQEGADIYIHHLLRKAVATDPPALEG